MIIIFLIVILFLGVFVGNWYLDEKAPEEQVEATLIKKKRVSSMDANNVITDNYFLIFQVNSESKKFKVRKTIYNQYEEHEKGILIFKRNRFVNFVLK